MGFEIFHTVNFGLYIRSGDAAILCDGLFNKIEGFSDTPEEIKRQLREGAGMFSDLDAAVFTHRHPDHYSPELVSLLAKCPGPPAVWYPEAGDSALHFERLSPELSLARIGNTELYAMKTVHDGSRFKDVAHVSLLLRSEGTAIFIAGDAALGERESAILKAFEPVSAGFFMFYQLYSAPGRHFAREMKFREIYLCHLPLPGDDAFSYRRMAERLKAGFPADLQKIHITEPMSNLFVS